MTTAFALAFFDADPNLRQHVVHFLAMLVRCDDDILKETQERVRMYSALSKKEQSAKIDSVMFHLNLLITQIKGADDFSLALVLPKSFTVLMYDRAESPEFRDQVLQKRQILSY